VGPSKEGERLGDEEHWHRTGRDQGCNEFTRKKSGFSIFFEEWKTMAKSAGKPSPEVRLSVAFQKELKAETDDVNQAGPLPK